MFANSSVKKLFVVNSAVCRACQSSSKCFHGRTTSVTSVRLPARLPAELGLGLGRSERRAGRVVSVRVRPSVPKIPQLTLFSPPLLPDQTLS